jgi:integrase
MARAKNRGLYKRGNIWYADFTVNGERYQQSLGTSNWNKALEKKREKEKDAQDGKLRPKAGKFGPRLGFGEAANRYSAERLAHLAPRSIATEHERLKPLRNYFAGMMLITISTDSILAYIGERNQFGAANRTINMEVGILRRILKRARLWARVSDDIRPLPERHNVGRALSYEDKVRLRKLAESKPEWNIARLAMTIALNTTMRACEIRGLQWRDVDFMERTLTVRRSKTEAGERIIPLNQDAWDAILELRERAKMLLGKEPEAQWYVFPHGEGQGPTVGKNRVSVKPDPTKPMSTWRTAWRRLTRVIYCPACGLLQDPGAACRNDQCKADISRIESPTAALRFHDMRHQAITELAESGASEQTIMSVSGHVSRKMLEHYSHIRLEAKREAVRVLSRVRSAEETEVHVTERVTVATENEKAIPQPLKNLVDVAGIEPATPCLQSRCSPS